MSKREAITRVKEAAFPFTWTSWDLADTAILQFYGVEWEEDFGVFKKGDRCECISVNYQEVMIEVWDDDGNVIAKQQFKAVPV